MALETLADGTSQSRGATESKITTKITTNNEVGGMPNGAGRERLGSF